MKYDYDLTVVGGGAGGLTAAGMGANLGAKTLMIEADKLGGDCTWYGCVPSKTLIHHAKTAHAIKKAEQLGHRTANKIDFGSVMEEVRKTRREIYEDADEPAIYRDMGIEVMFGRASFLGDHTLSINQKKGSTHVSSRYIIIATGSKATVPHISGIDDVVYYTNETIFELNEQPEKLAIIGAGPEGLELGQAFQRLGTEVTIFEQRASILPHDDEEPAKMLLKKLRNEGIDIKLSTSIKKILQDDDKKARIFYGQNGQEKVLRSEAILLAAGRAPNIYNLELNAAGINHTNDGIIVDKRCRTNFNYIYAVGDITGRYPFTHMADHMAKVAVTNALLKIPMKMDEKHVTWSTFTDPELAHVGASKKELEGESVSYTVYRFPYDKIDRALTEDATEGLIKIFATRKTGKILGVSVYGKQAGDLIGEYALAMKNGVSLRNISDTIHPYPTYGLGVRRAADQWYIKNQSRWMTKLIKWIFGYRGSVPDLSDGERIV